MRRGRDRPTGLKIHGCAAMDGANSPTFRCPRMPAIGGTGFATVPGRVFVHVQCSAATLGPNSGSAGATPRPVPDVRGVHRYTCNARWVSARVTPPPEACRAGCRVRPAAPRPRRSTAGMGSERHVHTAAVCRGCALAQRPDHVPARAARHPLHTVNQRAALDAGPPEIAEPLQRALQQPPVLTRCRAPKSAAPHRRARPTTPVSARSSPALLYPCRSPCPKGRPPKIRSDVFAVRRSQPVAC